MRLKQPVLLSILLTLTACQPAPPGCAHLPGGGSYCLQSTGGPSFATLQQSVLSAGNQRLTLLTRIESDARGLRFAGITPLGQTLLNISWENGALRAELPAVLAQRLDPALLPALVQLATWPAASVRAGLSADLELVDEPRHRRVRRPGSEENLLDISWEGNLPYQRLRIAAPGGLAIDARAVVDGADE